jgi:hypothetical protein
MLSLAAAVLTAAAPAPTARPLELVIANENLVEVGADLDKRVDEFARRVEEVAGFAKGALRAKGFTRPADALAYIKKQRCAFAILPAHELLEGRKALKLEPLGRAVSIYGDQLAYYSVTRKPRPFGGIGEAAGMRLATTDTHDRAWLMLMFDGNLDVAGLKLLEVPTPAAGVQAVLDKKADLALVPEPAWKDGVGKRTEEGGDLEFAFRSPDTPPSAVVAVGRFVAAADKQRLAAAVDKICKTTGAAACGYLRIQYIEAGRADSYANVTAAYDGYAARFRR